jgi:exodeoxyribonuclease V alpha subunit
MNAPMPKLDDQAIENALPRLMARRITKLAQCTNRLDAEITGKVTGVLLDAMENGDVCVDLATVVSALKDSDAPSSEQIVSSLRASGLVSMPGEDKALPLVMDESQRIYLYRYHDCEARLARQLLTLAESPVAPISNQAIQLIQTLFAPNAERLAGRIDWQKLAVARVLTSRLTIISGGPGTGKTTTVANFLACMLTDSPELRVALAAPTGKAAARMEEALRERAISLPQELRERLPSGSFTLHRLLGFNPSTNHYRFHRENPLPYDVVVVDEASMIDVALAARLVDAIGEGTRLVILGDKDQLAAVENGVVLGDIAADARLSADTRQTLAPIIGITADVIESHLPKPLATTPLRDHVIWLRENYRFKADSGIGQLALRINDGEAELALNLLRDKAQQELSWDEDGQVELSKQGLDTLANGYAEFANVVKTDQSPGKVLDAFGEYRILTALRNGPRGAVGIGERIEQRLRRTIGHPKDHGGHWYPGRVIIVLENDYGVRLFNGDIGVTLLDGDDFLVWFKSQNNELRSIAPSRLPRHTQALALTVHKAQGSEFRRVSIVLPSEESRVLTRELLYTGVTRAKEHVEIIGDEGRLRDAIDNPTKRAGGLLNRLWGKVVP